MGEPTVLASLAETLLTAAKTAELNIPRLCEEAEIEGVRFGDPDLRLPFRLYGQLWESVQRRMPQQSFGLQTASQFSTAATYGIVGYLAKTSATVGEGFQKAIEYLRIINERGIGAVSQQEDGTSRFTFAPSATSGAASDHTEAMLASFVVLSRRWSGVDLKPIEISFRHSAPPQTDVHDRIFGCPIHFGAEENAIVLSAEVAAIPLTTSDPVLNRILVKRAKSLLSGMPQRSNLLKDVEAIVRENIAEGAPTVATISRRLGLSSRTLQRRLAGEGVSYASLLDRFRRENALKLLEDDRLAIHDVSMLLGFSEPKAFRRAFKRWTGVSPRSHRNLRRMGQLSAAA